MRLNVYRRAGVRTRIGLVGGGLAGGGRLGRGGYLSPTCSLTPPSPFLSVVPLLLLLAAAALPSSSSSVFSLFDSGWSCSSPFCLLVGREAEAEACVARRWRGFATAGGKEDRIY